MGDVGNNGAYARLREHKLPLCGEKPSRLVTSYKL